MMLLRSNVFVQVLSKRFYASSFLNVDMATGVASPKCFPPLNSNDSTYSLDKWHLSIGLVLYRMPVVTQPMSEIEKRFSDMCIEKAEEASLKSDFELKTEKDEILLKKRKQNELEGKDVSAIDDEIGIANKDLEQQWEATRQKLVSKYKLDDLSALSYDKDPHTMWKQWQHKLLLLVRQKNAAFDSSYVPSGEEEKNYASPWIVPELRNNGEPLRQTAEKCLSNIVKSEIPVKILGNAPLAYVRREYPKKLQKILKTEKTGVVIFFYTAQLDPMFLGPVEFNEKMISDYRWCAKTELDDLIQGNPGCTDYRKRLQRILLE